MAAAVAIIVIRRRRIASRCPLCTHISLTISALFCSPSCWPHRSVCSRCSHHRSHLTPHPPFLSYRLLLLHVSFKPGLHGLVSQQLNQCVLITKKHTFKDDNVLPFSSTSYACSGTMSSPGAVWGQVTGPGLTCESQMKKKCTLDGRFMYFFNLNRLYKPWHML